MGIDWDGGPFFQSESRDRHRQVVADLLADGRAYLSERVDEENVVVDGNELVDGLAVRYRVPKDRQVTFTDAVRGEVSFDTNELEDFVIWRSNGSPTFLLANAVDDADMGITHAIRGEDLLSTTPKVQLLMEEIGVEPPIYGHLPLLVNEQRKKLSKRRDDVSIADYRTRGYLPDAMVNYLALLGWGPDDDIEIRPIAEIIEKFDLSRVNKAPAFFDLKKLDHFSSTYIQELPADEFVELAMPYLQADERWSSDVVDPALVAEFATDVQQRVSTLSDVVNWYDWLFLDTVQIEEKAMNKGLRKAKRGDEVLDGVIEAFADCPWDEDTLNQTVRQVGDALGVKSAVPVRVAVTGKMGGIPLYGPLVRLGREQTIQRLRAARDQIISSE